MPETRAGKSKDALSETDAPIILKNGIATLHPKSIARGAFGEVYTGRILNPIGLLAERIVLGEENPRWLGLDDIAYAEPEPGKEKTWLPQPLSDPAQRRKVHQAAARLWEDYLGRRRQDPGRAAEEYRDLLSLLDPLLLQESTIAVKVLVPPSGPDPDLEARIVEESVRRFIKENDILRGLRHPGIVRRLGLVEDATMGWCLLLEYIEGETLDEHLRKYEGRRMPLPVAALRIRDIVEAIAYIHGNGIIHRDLKPQNIMIRDDTGQAVIMDFGIGKWSDESQTQQLTIPGARIGTPRYMAPEQAVPDGIVTKATDVCQLSTVLFEMMTGHAAYEGMDLTRVFAWLSDRSRRHPVYVADHLPQISRELEALVEVGRDKDPDKRWTIEEFREKLDEIIAQGRYEGKESSTPLTPTELQQALQKTRMRKKETHWEEHLLETRLHYVNLQSRIEEARACLHRGAYAEARAAIRALAEDAAPLPPRYDSLKTQIDLLTREVETASARNEAEQLLTKAEEDYAAQRFSEVGVRLQAAAERLAVLPGPKDAGLHDRYKALSDAFESQHRSVVDLFDTLRRSFVVKIQQHYDELQEAYGARGTLDPDRIRHLLQQATLAGNNLELIDREKVGPASYDRTKKDLEDQREALEDLLKRALTALPAGEPTREDGKV